MPTPFTAEDIIRITCEHLDPVERQVTFGTFKIASDVNELCGDPALFDLCEFLEAVVQIFDVVEAVTDVLRVIFELVRQFRAFRRYLAPLKKFLTLVGRFVDRFSGVVNSVRLVCLGTETLE